MVVAIEHDGVAVGWFVNKVLCDVNIKIIHDCILLENEAGSLAHVGPYEQNVTK